MWRYRARRWLTIAGEPDPSPENIAPATAIWEWMDRQRQVAAGDAILELARKENDSKGGQNES